MKNVKNNKPDPQNVSLPLWLRARTSLSGLTNLISQVGIVGVMIAIADLALKKIMAEPYRGWPKAIDQREKLSRAQIADAIILFRHFKQRFSEERAIAILRPVIIEATVVFLSSRVGVIEKSQFDNLSEGEQLTLIESKTNQFFNATQHIESFSEQKFYMKVTNCHFVQICKQANVMALAPLFCEGDLHYFNQKNQKVGLTRPSKLTSQDSSCDFHFQWKE